MLDTASMFSLTFVNVFAFVITDLLVSRLARAFVVKRNVLAGGSRLVTLVHAKLAFIYVFADFPSVSL